MQLDSQDVLARYHRALLALPTPKAVIFTYSMSQAGPQQLEQTHRIYRSGELVRDETLATEGQNLKRKLVRIARYPDRYAVARLAPRPADYAFVFQRMNRTGGRAEYVYGAVPTARGGAYVVDAIAIDAATFLPASIRFTIDNGTQQGKGELHYARSGTYWVPQLAQVDATVHGKPARERITFSGYRFPNELPAQTFRSPKPLPTPRLPSF